MALAREICRFAWERAVDFLAANDEKLNSQQFWLTDLNSFLFSAPPVILQNFLASDFNFSIFQAIFPFILPLFSPIPPFLNKMPPKTSQLVQSKPDEVPRKTAKESHLLLPNTKSQAKVDQHEAKKREKRQATIKLHRSKQPESNEQSNTEEAEPEQPQEHNSNANTKPDTSSGPRPLEENMGDLNLPDIINKPKNVDCVTSPVLARSLASDFHHASIGEPQSATPDPNPHKEGDTIHKNTEPSFQKVGY